MLDPRPEPLLGARSPTRRSNHRAPLERDVAVVLYTDGLIERRHHDVDTGLKELRDALSAGGI